MWRAVKARELLRALNRLGWIQVRQNGSHRILRQADGREYVFAFHDGDEIGRRILPRIARDTGLTPEDL